MAASTACLFLMALGAQALTETWVREPKPELFADIAAKEDGQHIKDSHMVVKEMKGLDKDRDMYVMDFPEAERYVVPQDYVQHGRDAKGFATELCRLYSERGSVGHVLEVGAGIGTQTMHLAECLEGTPYTLFAVEPDPDLADHLRAGIVANELKNVQVYPYEMMQAQPANTVQMNKVRGKDHHTAEITANLTTGDAALKSNIALTALMMAKVTLQGREGLFFEGAQDMFRFYPPCILAVQLNSDLMEPEGTKVKDMVKLLQRWGYKKTRGARSIPSLKELKERKDKLWIIEHGNTEAEHEKCVKNVMQREDDSHYHEIMTKPAGGSLD